MKEALQYKHSLYQYFLCRGRHRRTKCMVSEGELRKGAREQNQAEMEGKKVLWEFLVQSGTIELK